MDTFFQQLVNGLSTGSIYAMVAVGLTLIFGVLELINFAHGEFFMAGAFALYLLKTKLDIPYLPSIFIAIAALAILGWFTRRSLGLQPQKPFETMILLTLGASVILQNGALAVWGPSFRYIPTSLTQSRQDILGIFISDQRLLVLVVSPIAFTLLELFIRHTKSGKAMRAVAQNYYAASVVGINIDYIVSLTFVMGIGLAGLAGALIAPIISANPRMGVGVLMKSFAVIVMGGRGNMRGAIISALIIGVVESLTTQYISLAFKDVFAFVVLIAVLIVRPEGLFGRKAGLV
jgi:branched-chain amino acid transport system permease protein